MNGKDLLHAMREIDSPYIAEAEAAGPQRRPAPLWGWLTAAAACLVLVCAVGLILRPSPQGGPAPSAPQEDISLSTEPGASTSPTQAPDPTAPTGGVLLVDMDDVLVNENCARFVSCYTAQDGLLPLTWDKDDVVAYFGWDLTPTYIPEKLYRIDKNGNIDESGQVQVYGDAEGRVGEGPEGPVGIDTVSISYDQTCMRADLLHRHGFTLAASRQGNFEEDFSVFADESMSTLLPEELIQVTDIGGTPVIFGHIHYGYGLYGADTHVPAGYYEIYMAKFSVGGVEYRILAHDLTLRDVVTLTADVIYQNTEGYHGYAVTG